jgi:hypothetical protein
VSGGERLVKIVLVIVAVIVLARLTVPALVFTGIGLVALWYVSLLVYPEKQCGWCGGKGARGGGGFMRKCGSCQGTGRVKRMGAP